MKRNLFITGLILPIIFFTNCNNARYGDKKFYLPNTFLIPSNYEGVLRVVYEEKCGGTPMIENGRQIISFKDDGLIILNTELDLGKDNLFFLVDSNGNKKPIVEIPDFAGRTDKTPAIVVGPISVSTQYITSLNGNVTTTSGGATCANFKLYNKNSNEIKDEEFYQKLDSSTNAAVNACRGGQ